MQIDYPAIQILCRICFKWRQIVCATPRLWTRVYLKFTSYLDHRSPPYAVSNNSISILELNLKKSGHLALEIIMDIRTSHFHACDGSSHSSSESVFDLIFVKNPTKLGSLLFRRSQGSEIPSIWYDLIESYTTSPAGLLSEVGYPNLVKLEFRTSSTPRNNARTYHLFKDTPVPQLVSGSLNGRHYSVSVPMGNLTSLHLDAFPINQCIDILIQCPQLVTFRLTEPLPPVSGKLPDVQSDSICTFSDLKHLEWSFRFEEWDRILMARFRFSSLSAFRADGQYGSRQQDYRPLPDLDFTITYWIPLLSSFNKLEEICLSTDLFRLESYKHVWNALNHIETLVSLHLTCVYRCDVDQQREGILRPLAHSPETLGHPPLPMNLPHIRFLRLDLWHVDCLAGNSKNADAFLLLLEARARNANVPGIKSLQLHGHPFDRFDAESPIWRHWTEDQCQRLERIMEDGLKVIWTREEPHWLK
jgi:hypothetical protein